MIFFDESQFMNDDHKVQYYTGLPSAKLLQHVFELVLPSLAHDINIIGDHLL